MGNCIKCNIETKNQYERYSANVTSAMVTGLFNENIGTKLAYSNFEYHHQYVCTKCLYKEGGFLMYSIFTLIKKMVGIQPDDSSLKSFNSAIRNDTFSDSLYENFLEKQKPYKSYYTPSAFDYFLKAKYKDKQTREQFMESIRNKDNNKL